MILAKIAFYLTAAEILCVIFGNVDGRSVQTTFHSDTVVTKWPEENSTDADGQKPGWMRKQLMKFGEVASKVGNMMGAHATKISSAIDKVCEIVKTVIPLLAAVCHVGQFRFCAATEGAPGDLSLAMSPTSLNLDEPDRKK